MVRISRRRRWLLSLGLLLLPTAFFVRPAAHLLRTSLRDKAAIESSLPGVANDASRLNRTQVAEVWDIPSDAKNAEEQLVRLVERARREKLPVAIAGARHSMG